MRQLYETTKTGRRSCVGDAVGESNWLDGEKEVRERGTEYGVQITVKSSCLEMDGGQSRVCCWSGADESGE